MLVELDAGQLETDSIGVRLPARRDQKVCAFDRALPLRALCLDSDPMARASLDLMNLGSQQDLDSFVYKQILEGGANVGIFAAGELRAGFDHGHPRAKSPNRLRELKTHVAAAQHDQMLGQSIEVESLHMRHRFRSLESRQFRDGRAGTEVEKHTVGENGSFATAIEINLDGSRSYESSIPHYQFSSARGGAIGVHLMEPFDHQPFAPLNNRHIDAYRLGFEAEFRAPPGQCDDLGGIDHVLASVMSHK